LGEIGIVGQPGGVPSAAPTVTGGTGTGTNEVHGDVTEEDELTFEIDLREPVASKSGEGPSKVTSQPAPPPPPPPRMKKKIKSSTARSVGGKLDADEVQRAISAKMNELRGCLRADLVVQLDATVGRDGTVEEAHAVASQPDDSQARDCVAFTLRGASLGQTGASDSALFRLRLSLRRR
jgi:hypothetical protein